MPSSKPEIKIRGTESQIELWKQTAEDSGDSLNSWACDALDAAADFVASPVREDRDTKDAYLPAEKEREIARLQKLVKEYESGGAGKVRELARKQASNSGCPFDTPHGTKCKACGKTH